MKTWKDVHGNYNLTGWRRYTVQLRGSCSAANIFKYTAICCTQNVIWITWLYLTVLNLYTFIYQERWTSSNGVLLTPHSENANIDKTATEENHLTGSFELAIYLKQITNMSVYCKHQIYCSLATLFETQFYKL